jgi:hypothetical protein
MLYRVSGSGGTAPSNPAAKAAGPCTITDLFDALLAQLDREQCRDLTVRALARLHETEDGY